MHDEPSQGPEPIWFRLQHDDLGRSNCLQTGAPHPAVGVRRTDAGSRDVVLTRRAGLKGLPGNRRPGRAAVGVRPGGLGAAEVVSQDR